MARENTYNGTRYREVGGYGRTVEWTVDTDDTMAVVAGVLQDSPGLLRHDLDAQHEGWDPCAYPEDSMVYGEAERRLLEGLPTTDGTDELDMDVYGDLCSAIFDIFEGEDGAEGFVAGVVQRMVGRDLRDEHRWEILSGAVGHRAAADAHGDYLGEDSESRARRRVSVALRRLLTALEYLDHHAMLEAVGMGEGSARRLVDSFVCDAFDATLEDYLLAEEAAGDDPER